MRNIVHSLIREKKGVSHKRTPINRLQGVSPANQKNLNVERVLNSAKLFYMMWKMDKFYMLQPS